MTQNEKREPRRLNVTVDAALRRLNGGDTSAIGGIFGNWRTIVGEAIADHAQPVLLEKRVLVVNVDDPAWATQLRFLHDEVLHTLRTYAGDNVDRIDIRVRRTR
jgi:predicted nucleic acid-binding Zn ribbon protein